MPRSTSAFAGPQNRELLDAQYSRWQSNPESVEPSWQAFFSGVEFAGNGIAERCRIRVGQARSTPSGRSRPAHHRLPRPRPPRRPHRPLLEDKAPRRPVAHQPRNASISAQATLEPTVDGSMFFGIAGPVRLGELHRDPEGDVLPDRRRRVHAHADIAGRGSGWPSGWSRAATGPEPGLRQKHRTLMTLHQAELFEKFLHTKYVGQKRFSLEGGETLIPMLDAIVETGPVARREGVRHRHGPPRPAERAREHPQQAVRGDLQRVRGQLPPRRNTTATAT